MHNATTDHRQTPAGAPKDTSSGTPDRQPCGLVMPTNGAVCIGHDVIPGVGPVHRLDNGAFAAEAVWPRPTSDGIDSTLCSECRWVGGQHDADCTHRDGLIVRGYPNPIGKQHRDPFIGACPAWCESLATGHEVESHDEDRVHFSEVLNVEHRYGRAEFIAGSRQHERTATVELPWVQAYLLRRNGQAEPRIHVGEFELAGFELTPTEAVALSDVLRELAKQAEL